MGTLRSRFPFFFLRCVRSFSSRAFARVRLPSGIPEKTLLRLGETP